MSDAKDISGVYIYTGIPGSGKTYLAAKMISAQRQQSGRWTLIVDSEDTLASTFPDAELIANPMQMPVERGKIFRFHPSNVDDVDAACRVAYELEDCIFLCDEVGYWATANQIPEYMERLFRAHRHVRCAMHVTTQYISDIHQRALQCFTHLYTFRQSSERALDRMEKEFRLDRAKLQVLKVGEYEYRNKWDA